MNNLYDVLEICLEEMENGADLDTVLFRHPEYAEELRPILETSAQAKSLAAAEPSPELVRRGRAKVLQQASQMREARVQPSRRVWSVPLRRALVSLAVIAVLFISSTGLVQASSNTLPGDNLYPVKRTWEDVRLLFAFNTQAREALEIEHENERLEELNELFAEGRSVKVDFAGLLSSQEGDLWTVSNIPVRITAQTDLRAGSVGIGAALRVRGVTQPDGSVLAERVDLLAEGQPLPSMSADDEPELEQETSGNQNEGGEDNSGSGSGDESPEAEETKASDEESGSSSSTVSGTVDSISGTVLVVNGQPMSLTGAEIKGTPRVGATVKVEGYLDDNGLFIVTKIEFQDPGSDGGDATDDGGNDGGSTDSNDENTGSGNDNGNDDGGDDNGGGNSGSGSGGGSGNGDDD